MSLPEWCQQLVEIIFDFNTEKYVLDVDSVLVANESSISTKYRTKLQIKTDDARLLSMLYRYKNVRIYSRRDTSNALLCEGIFVKSTSSLMEGISYLGLEIENKIYNKLKNTVIDVTRINGDFGLELSKILKNNGILSKRTMNKIKIVKRNVVGYLLHVIDAICAEFNVVWNIFNDVVYFGNELSKRVIQYDPASIEMVFGCLINERNGEYIKKFNVSTGLNTEIIAGTKLIVGNNDFYVVEVNHQYSEDFISNNAKKSTNMVLVGTIDDVYNYVAVKNEFGDIDDRNKSTIANIKHEMKTRYPCYNDGTSQVYINRNIAIFTKTTLFDIKPIYLDIGSVVTDAAFGYPITKPSRIKEITMLIYPVDGGYMEVMKDTTSLYILNTDVAYRNETVDIKIDPGLLIVRYIPPGLPTGIDKAIVKIIYQEVAEYV